MDDELIRLRDTCTRALVANGPARPAELLATIPPDTAVDRYGDGGVVTVLEQEIADLLGKPAAVYLPSGTMAQQSTLRVHADRRGRRTVAWHPRCHLDQHEDAAHTRLHGLVSRPVGDPERIITIDDLRGIAEPLAALLLELPQRDLGGQQPEWDDLVAQTTWARETGAAVHLDGARLWESAAGYGRPLADVAALFDSAYVSFYKILGALPGCCVAGEADVVAEVREWRHRMGGALAALWPGAASARTCLQERLPRLPAYLEHARAIAAALRGIPGVDVVPDPPQTPMMHLLLRTTREAFTATATALAREGLWTWTAPFATPLPDVQRVELAVGDATCALGVDEIVAVVSRFIP
jgi:threonine aldolase